MKTRQFVVPLRVLSFVTALLFSWSLILASTVRAATAPPLVPFGHSRVLSIKEMSSITGAAAAPGGDGGGSTGTGGGGTGTGGTYVNPAATPGAAYPWIGSVGGVSTYTGNKSISVPVVSWTQRGGLPVSLTLTHNSQSSRNGELGPKWLHSYDSAIMVDTSGNATVYWGNGSVYTFTKNINGGYTAPPGIHDTLILTGGPNGHLIQQTGYTIKTKDQNSFYFTAGTTATFYRLVSIYDENNNYINIGYTSTNLVQTITDATGRKLTLGYSGSTLISVTDPLNRQWQLTYDTSGNLAHVYCPVINGTNYHVDFGYNSSNDVTSFTDMRGNPATFFYNSDNSLQWEKDNAGSQTSFSYSSTGTTITDPNGHTATHTYNSAGQLASITDALNYAEYYTYDTANNVTQKQDRRGYTSNATYDGMGNVLTATPPGGIASTMTYNTHNRLLTATAPLGRSVAVTYDTNDNPTEADQKNAAGVVVAVTKLTIGSYGLVSDKYDANNHHTSYTYDANGYLNSTTTPLGNKTVWTYDALGFGTSRTDAMGRTTTYTPDAWERNTKTSYPDGTANSYGYDPNGNLTAFNNYTANWTRTYDADNRMTAEYFSGNRNVTHAYDGPGQKGLLSSVTDYDGRVISYAYSARNELASVSEASGTETYAYDADGNQSHRYLPNGLRTDQYYNGDGTLDSFYNWNGTNTIFQSYGYGYNADHQMTGYNEGTSSNVHGTANQTSVAYGYDALGHLTSDTRTGSYYAYAKSYSVDGAGNRLTMNEDGGATTLFHDADDQLNSCSGTGAYGYTYNKNGDQITSTINGQQTTFAYDFDDQLVSITKAGSATTFRYDALGRQVSRAVNGAFTGYYLDGSSILVEKGPGGTVQYTWGNGLIRRGSEYPLTDGQGTTKLVTNSSQAVTSGQETEAFGRTIGGTGSTSSPFGYHGAAGYRSDGDGPAGLEPYQKVGARYYDATFGRFITRDTDLSQSPYAYCDGDPVNCTDPTGHDTEDPTPDDIKKLIEEAEKALAALGLGSGSGTKYSDPQPVQGATADPGGNLGFDIGNTNLGVGNLGQPGNVTGTATETVKYGPITATGGVTGGQGIGPSYNASVGVSAGNFNLTLNSGGQLNGVFSLKF